LNHAPCSIEREVEDYVDHICGDDNWTLCFVGFIAIIPVTWLAGGAALYIVSVFIFMPVQAWSPLFIRAAKQEGDSRLQRLPALSWVISLLATTTVLLGLYENIRLEGLQGSKQELISYLFLSLANLAALMAAIVWMNNPHSLTAL
jgi:hypothetical protein